MGMTGLYYILKQRNKITADSSDSNVEIQNRWTKKPTKMQTAIIRSKQKVKILDGPASGYRKSF